MSENVILELIKRLECYGYPVLKQGSMSNDDEYPETLLTYWNPENNVISYYDNRPQRIAFTFWIYCYSTSYKTVLSIMDRIESDLRSAGYLIASKPYDVDSDVPTHTGRMISVTYIKNGGNENE